MKPRNTILAALLAAVLLGPKAHAAFEDVGAGGRAPGMGNVFSALADDLYAVYYNPSGLAQLERPQFSAAYSKLHVGLSDGSDLGLSQLTYAHPLKSGRWGTLGGGWQRFALDSIYSETSLYLSWGRRILSLDSGGRLLGGLNLKYLTHSFKQLPEAFNAMDQLNATNQPDPVLAGNTSAGAVDADLGLLYRFPRRFQAGLMIQHLNQPDVGFAAKDTLPINLRLGLAYKTLWMNLAGEFRHEPSPTGSTDKDFIVAAERYFPTLEFGQFGLRGSIGFGSREWKQVTAGLSYRINKIQLDYAFLMPIGTVEGTAGTHRIALTFHFGAPTPEEEVTKDLLLQTRQMNERGAFHGYEFIDATRPRELDDPSLEDVRLYADSGQFRKAHRRLVELARELPPDQAIVRLSNRLTLTAYYYPELRRPEDRWEVALSTAINHFLYARDRKALLFAAYAFSMRPEDPQLGNFLTQLEKSVGAKAERLPPNHPRTFIAELLYRVEAANNRGDHKKVLSILDDILTLEPGNATAVERAGTTYFVIKEYRKAIETWEKALQLEQNSGERRALMTYINRARRKLEMSPKKFRTGRSAAPRPRRPVRAPRRAERKPKPPVRRADPDDVRRLYQKGVEFYARGERLQATAMFMRILRIDPNNAPAQKALERLRRR